MLTLLTKLVAIEHCVHGILRRRSDKKGAEDVVLMTPNMFHDDHRQGGTSLAAISVRNLARTKVAIRAGTAFRDSSRTLPPSEDDLRVNDN